VTKFSSEPLRGDFWMNDIDDAQIKAEIDGIMKGVKDIMKKIDALAPKEQTGQDPVEGHGENPDPPNGSSTRKE
jgi:hypothetical protein